MNFDTDASAKAPVDLTDATVSRAPMTFLHQLRDLLMRTVCGATRGAPPGLIWKAPILKPGTIPLARVVEPHARLCGSRIRARPRVQLLRALLHAIAERQRRVSGNDAYAEAVATHQPTGASRRGTRPIRIVCVRGRHLSILRRGWLCVALWSCRYAGRKLTECVAA